MLVLALVLIAVLSGRSLEAASASLSGGDKEPPKVVTLEPENLADDIDAKKTKRIVVTFDRPMTDTGWSFCGGGPNFPTFKNKPHWDLPTKIVVEVELLPEHDYELKLNCPPSGTNFKSLEGTQLVPVPWTFSTLPEKLPDQAKQKADNRAALDVLKAMLAESYSYYDLRVRSWEKLFAAHESAIVGAKTTRSWARQVAKMLAATEDIHMSLRFGELTFATGTRAIDPLYRSKNLAAYVPTVPAGKDGLQGRTHDGIGYVMIPSWGKAEEIAAIENALASLRACKAIVVDVRPNSGGDELLAQRVAAWFVDGTQVYGKDRFREKAGKDGFGKVLERTIEGNKEADKHLAMPIAVLTSRYVMSSNESFVLMMRQAKDCTVVGQKTYGSSGNPKPHVLPNEVTIVVPSWQDLRPDGTCFEGEGLAPDVEVKAEAKDFESKDQILDKALAVLREKIKRGSSGSK
jgi:hypothetical protein